MLVPINQNSLLDTSNYKSVLINLLYSIAELILLINSNTNNKLNTIKYH